MEPYLFFLGLVIPQIVFGYAFLYGVAWIFKRDDEARVERERVEYLQALIRDPAGTEESEETLSKSA